jgi:hypothetical protein
LEGDLREIEGRLKADWRQIGGRLEADWRQVPLCGVWTALLRINTCSCACSAVCRMPHTTCHTPHATCHVHVHALGAVDTVEEWGKG